MRVILSWINHFWICWTTVWYALPANIFYLIGSILVQTWSKITCLWTRRIMNHLILKKRVLEKYGPDHIKLVWKMDQISGPETRPIYFRHRAILNCGLKFQTTVPDRTGATFWPSPLSHEWNFHCESIRFDQDPFWTTINWRIP